MSQKHSFAILFISLFILLNLTEENRPQSPHKPNLTDSISSKATHFLDSEASAASCRGAASLINRETLVLR
jgi:hypothetical protein